MLVPRPRLETFDPKTRAMLELPVSSLRLDLRTINMLEAEGICDLHTLLHCREADLLSVNGLGKKRLYDIFQALALLGFARVDNPHR